MTIVTGDLNDFHGAYFVDFADAFYGSNENTQGLGLM